MHVCVSLENSAPAAVTESPPPTMSFPPLVHRITEIPVQSVPSHSECIANLERQVERLIGLLDRIFVKDFDCPPVVSRSLSCDTAAAHTTADPIAATTTPQAGSEAVAMLPETPLSEREYAPSLKTGYTTENPVYCALSDRQLFYYLTNLETYPDAAPAVAKFMKEHLVAARTMLLRGFDPRLRDLALGEFSRHALSAFLKENYDLTCCQLDAYLQRWEARRRDVESSAVANEMLPSRSFAEFFIRQIAPTKLVDGCWLQNTCKTATHPDLRRVLKPLFKIYAEELGQGDPQMNHVNLYRKLLESVDIILPDVASLKFIHESTGILDTAFTAPCIQLGLAEFSEQLLPEIIGFNLGYEQLPLHMLVTARELQHLGIDSYYFQLHVVIDNPSSGHARLAQDVAFAYLSWIKATQGTEMMQEHYLRMLTGYMLNEVNPLKGSLDTARSVHLRTKVLPPAVASPATQAMLQMLANKLPFAARIHPGKMLGCRPLNAWMVELTEDIDCGNWTLRAMKFLAELENSSWIVPGCPESSPFLTDLCAWGGCMFGVFTKGELAVVEEWICTLRRPGVGQDNLQGTSPSLANSWDSPDDSSLTDSSLADSEFALSLVPNTPSETLSRSPESEAREKMIDLICAKRQRGSRSHGSRTLADSGGIERKINDWFDDPEGFLDALLCFGIERLLKSVEHGGSMESYFSSEEIAVVKTWAEQQLRKRKMLDEQVGSLSFVSYRPCYQKTAKIHNSGKHGRGIRFPTYHSKSTILTLQIFPCRIDCPFTRVAAVGPDGSRPRHFAGGCVRESPPAHVLFDLLVNFERSRPAHVHAAVVIQTSLLRAQKAFQHFHGTSISSRADGVVLFEHLTYVDTMFSETLPGAMPQASLGSLPKSRTAELLTRISPVFIAGTWTSLENLTRLRTHGGKMGSAVLRAMMKVMGYEDERGKLFDAWKVLSRKYNVRIPHPSLTASNHPLPESSYALANLRLAFSLFPGKHAPELLGIALHSVSESSVETEIFACLSAADGADSAGRSVCALRCQVFANILEAVEGLIEDARLQTNDADRLLDRVVTGYVAAKLADEEMYEQYPLN